MPAQEPAAVAATEVLHAWVAGGAQSAEALASWVGARLAAHEAALAALLAVVGPRTPANSLRLYDAAIEQLQPGRRTGRRTQSVSATRLSAILAHASRPASAMRAALLSLN